MDVIVFDSTELENKLKELEAANMTELDIVHSLIEEGYTPDSFRYDAQRYSWFKNVAKKHHLVVEGITEQ